MFKMCPNSSDTYPEWNTPGWSDHAAVGTDRQVLAMQPGTGMPCFVAGSDLARMTPARILIVDDDATICQTFAAALTHEGYAVRVATTPTEALKQLAIETPHAILLDLDMPFINGVGFLYRLREQ